MKLLTYRSLDKCYGNRKVKDYIAFYSICIETEPRPHGHMSLLKKTGRNVSSRFLQERHMAVGTRLYRNVQGYTRNI